MVRMVFFCRMLSWRMHGIETSPYCPGTSYWRYLLLSSRSFVGVFNNGGDLGWFPTLRVTPGTCESFGWMESRARRLIIHRNDQKDEEKETKQENGFLNERSKNEALFFKGQFSIAEIWWNGLFTAEGQTSLRKRAKKSKKRGLFLSNAVTLFHSVLLTLRSHTYSQWWTWLVPGT